MKLKYFPDPYEIIDIDGIALISDEMNTEILFEAYDNGIFPWPHDDLPVLWFCPDPRGVLEFKDFHIPKSLIKDLKKTNWTMKISQNFPAVINSCAEQYRPDQGGTWITPQMLNCYKEFHNDGFVHSFECWDGDELIGGMYGVFINGHFSGESMFFKQPNASKAALLFLVKILKEAGIKWMDIQMVTDHMKRFGGKEMAREEFLDKRRKKNNIKLKIDNVESIQSVLNFF